VPSYSCSTTTTACAQLVRLILRLANTSWFNALALRS
jgi:hypothetical protein